MLNNIPRSGYATFCLPDIWLLGLVDTVHGILCAHVCSHLSRGRVAGTDGNSACDFSRKCWSAVHGGHTTLHPTSPAWRCHGPHVHTDTRISCFLGGSRPEGSEAMSPVLSVHISQALMLLRIFSPACGPFSFSGKHRLKSMSIIVYILVESS